MLLHHFDDILGKFGDTAKGAHWPNEKDRRKRFDVMLDVIEQSATGPVVLCDLGCGTGELLAHIRRRELNNIVYVGADRSKMALAYARAKFPDATFVDIDVTARGADLDLIACDYLVANGLFTVKFELSQAQMWSFLETTICRVWPRVRRGVAFNLMSKVVDWERDDLFHVPMDDTAHLLHGLAGRRVRMRADYGLYEYTSYAYKSDHPTLSMPAPAPRAEAPIPVLRPLLPRADRLMPYLRRIDAARVYSNYGALTLEFEQGVADRLALPARGVVSASSGTTALVGTILAVAGKARPERLLALVPAFTFVATAAAVERCGYQPYIADVDPTTWMLDPVRLAQHPLLDRIGVVVPVAPFGRPVPQAQWQEFQRLTGIPVVIDGAASFDTVEEAPDQFLGPIPLIMSFHATKCFATGEGGGVATTDVDLARRVKKALNYGFHSARDSRSPSTNGKMSEFHAAVGLAELDGWGSKKAALRAVVARYRRRLTRVGLADRYVASPDIGASYNLFLCRSLEESAAVQESLRFARIDFRLWYGEGLQHQTYFRDVAHDALGVSEEILPRLLGLPTAPDLADASIARIVAALTEGARGAK